jgi:hypothetical protein
MPSFRLRGKCSVHQCFEIFNELVHGALSEHNRSDSVTAHLISRKGTPLARMQPQRNPSRDIIVLRLLSFTPSLAAA